MRWKRYRAFVAIVCMICMIGCIKASQVFADELVIEGTAPSADASYTVKNSVATVTLNASSDYGIQEILYIYGSISSPDNSVWDTLGVDITNDPTLQVTESRWVSFRVTDTKGNMTTTKIKVSIDFKAVWVSYLEFKSTGYTEAEFKKQINTMFDNAVKQGMNAVAVHVRPFGDAMYQSKYFPWSKYCSGTQGKNPGFDPLKIMVDAAHKRGLAFHAWLNPYRVSTGTTDVNTLAANNMARKWLTDNIASNDRNVLSFGGNLYYNPSSAQVRNLIRNGIKEIVRNYDVDGIHFDDYFYPTLGSNYANLFDAPEYNAYVTDCKGNGIKPLTIANWRRRNVNWLIKNVYNDIKAIDSDVIFGISPGGFLDTLQMDDRYYCDIKTWMSKPGYVDYICPQVYWSFGHSTYPFDKTVNRWSALLKTNTVDLYIGIPVYKAGSKEEPEFKSNTNILVDMIDYCHSTGKVDGFMFYRYDYFYNPATKTAVQKLIKKLNE